LELAMSKNLWPIRSPQFREEVAAILNPPSDQEQLNLHLYLVFKCPRAQKFLAVAKVLEQEKSRDKGVLSVLSRL